MMRKLFCAAMAVLLVALFLATGLVFAAATGSCNTNGTPIIRNGEYLYTVYTFSWTSDDAAGSVKEVGGIAITGEVLEVRFKSDPTAIPTTGYDVELLTVAGENILSDGTANAGAAVPSAIDSAAQRRTPKTKDSSTKYLYNEIITPSISAAGNSKKGVVELFVH